MSAGKVRIGTCNYRSLNCFDIGYGVPNSVMEALKEGRIQIGTPEIKPGDRLLIDKEGRYHIETTIN